jgi:hypothetical protein
MMGKMFFLHQCTFLTTLEIELALSTLEQGQRMKIPQLMTAQYTQEVF